MIIYKENKRMRQERRKEKIDFDPRREKRGERERRGTLGHKRWSVRDPVAVFGGWRDIPLLARDIPTTADGLK